MQTLIFGLTVFGYFLTFSLLPVVLLTKKREPVATVAWIMAIVMMPYVGAFMFLVFGINRVARRVEHRTAVVKSFIRSVPQLAGHHHLSDSRLNELQAELWRLAERVSGTKGTIGNRIQLLTDAKQTFEDIKKSIAEARSSIHLEYYIWQPDSLGTELRDLLIEKARDGVAIRFLYDAIGSSQLTHRFLQPMRDAGIKVATFVPGRSFRERWSINLRSHRKIVIVDGKVGFTGGMNVGDEYLGRDPFFGHWRDTHLELHGPTVLQLQEVFAIDWQYATGEVLTASVFPSPVETGHVLAQILAGGPDGDGVFPTLMFTAINRAKLHITLSTSYFVPTPSLVSSLESAALRGVPTRVMLSGPKTYWATRNAARSYYDSLLKAGVQIYEYQAGQFHPKTLTIDGCWSLVGTPNFDSRSLYLNFEVAAAIYDKGIAEQLEHHFENDVKLARRIDLVEWSKRSTTAKLYENLCRMFSPVL
ncbi:MAG: cardiolipin synthase [Planctomycetes bacterium]|nr:cardiolipin synthase [Planctomycetota bacterium]